MTCNEFEEILPDYLTESGDPRKRSTVEKHMAECADCRESFHRGNPHSRVYCRTSVVESQTGLETAYRKRKKSCKRQPHEAT